MPDGREASDQTIYHGDGTSGVARTKSASAATFRSGCWRSGDLEYDGLLRTVRRVHAPRMGRVQGGNQLIWAFLLSIHSWPCADIAISRSYIRGFVLGSIRTSGGQIVTFIAVSPKNKNLRGYRPGRGNRSSEYPTVVS